LILDQVTNGVAVRMAVLYLLAGASSAVMKPRLTLRKRPIEAVRLKDNEVGNDH
jgi:hypothetical protein